MSTKRGPWIIKKKNQEYKDGKIELNVDDVIGPDNKKYKFGSVKIKPGVAILPIDDKGFIYLTKQFRYAINKYSIELVGGGIERGVSPLKAAQIELLEEAGIKAKTWISMGMVHPLTSQLFCPTYLFIAKDLQFGKQQLTPTEIIKLMKIEFKEAVNMVMENKIVAAPSNVLILKAQKYLKSKK